MISKNELKYIRSLNLKKFREEERKFIAEGKNSVAEGLKSSYKCDMVLYTEKFLNDNKDIAILAGKKKTRCEVLSENDFSRTADSVNPQGVLAVFNIPDRSPLDTTKLKGNLIYLDNISDPGNTGTIIRTCDWFGFKHIMLSRNTADIYNSKTIRASAGSVFHVNLYPDSDLQDYANELKSKGYDILAADMNGESIYSYNYSPQKVIILSNEANGTSEELLNYINNKIAVPRYGAAESLNVASAAAVILSHLKNIS